MLTHTFLSVALPVKEATTSGLAFASGFLKPTTDSSPGNLAKMPATIMLWVLPPPIDSESL
jgi:hypothetical protein